MHPTIEAMVNQRLVQFSWLEQWCPWLELGNLLGNSGLYAKV